MIKKIIESKQYNKKNKIKDGDIIVFVEDPGKHYVKLKFNYSGLSVEEVELITGKEILKVLRIDKRIGLFNRDFVYLKKGDN